MTTQGVQLYYEQLAIKFDPNLELLPAEKSNPSDLFGAGLSITKGLIWKNNFITADYKGQATSWGGGIDILTSDYYASFPDKSLIGLDLGVGFGSPVSGWRISTLASPITPRIDVTFWAEDY